MQQIGLVEHLSELRKRLLIAFIFFLVALIIALIFVGNIYTYLVTPAHGLKLVVLGPGDVVQIYLSIAGVAAFAVTTPFLLWQVWRFVGPGLKLHERKYAAKMIGPTSIMFILGLSFGYYVIFPEIFHFLRVLAQMHFNVMFTATEYFEFMFNIIVPFGILFELPVVVMFLTRIGVITPMWLRKVRRYAYFAFVILGVFISPPELISHLSVVIPMVLIYELSIGISVLAYRKKLSTEAWWRTDAKKEVGIVTASEPVETMSTMDDDHDVTMDDQEYTSPTSDSLDEEIEPTDCMPSEQHELPDEMTLQNDTEMGNKVVHKVIFPSRIGVNLEERE
ncbi:MAG: twin-arginine translocase subunit TatC [Acidibacillus sp.]|nr:twin-arginine translocase subunit TatC [Acidibacillus sp.]